MTPFTGTLHSTCALHGGPAERQAPPEATTFRHTVLHGSIVSSWGVESIERCGFRSRSR